MQKELNDYSKTRLDFDQQKDDTREVVIGGLGKDARERVLRIGEKAQFDLNNSVIDVELEDLAIQLSSLTTPISGIVTKIDAPYAGINVTPATAEIEVINPETVFFNAFADQTEVVKLHEGMSGTVTLDAYEDQEFVGTVENISFVPKAGETSTTYEIKIALPVDNAARQFLAGMSGDIEFDIQKHEDILVIPFSYLDTQGGKSYVYILKNNRKEKREVVLGLEVDDKVEIKKGVDEGEIIVREKK